MGDESPAVVSTWVHTRYTVRKILVMLVMLIVRCVSLRSLVWPRRQLDRCCWLICPREGWSTRRGSTPAVY